MSISIKNWAEEERPREKMLQKGAAALTDAELLAILISSGSKEKSALDLARDILALANYNLHELGKLNVLEFTAIKGIGEARAITISAALEIGRRRQTGEALNRNKIETVKDSLNILQPLLKDLHHEVFYVIYLNFNNKVLRHEAISSGGTTNTVVDVKLILKNSLLYNANKLIVAHNHPSGNKKASASDLHLTKQLKESAQLMDIQLLDHIIIAGNEYLSLADEGYL